MIINYFTVMIFRSINFISVIIYIANNISHNKRKFIKKYFNFISLPPLIYIFHSLRNSILIHTLYVLERMVSKLNHFSFLISISFTLYEPFSPLQYVLAHALSHSSLLFLSNSLLYLKSYIIGLK